MSETLTLTPTTLHILTTVERIAQRHAEEHASAHAVKAELDAFFRELRKEAVCRS